MKKAPRTSAKPEKSGKPASTSLLTKIMNPSTHQQVQASVLLFLIALVLTIGVVRDFSKGATPSLIKEDAVTSTPEAVAAVTNMVEEECREDPGSSPSVYAGQENKAALAAACSLAGGPPRSISK